MREEQAASNTTRRRVESRRIGLEQVSIEEGVAELSRRIVARRELAEVVEARIGREERLSRHQEELAPMWARGERCERRFEMDQCLAHSWPVARPREVEADA